MVMWLQQSTASGTKHPVKQIDAIVSLANEQTQARTHTHTTHHHQPCDHSATGLKCQCWNASSTLLTAGDIIISHWDYSPQTGEWGTKNMQRSVGKFVISDNIMLVFYGELRICCWKWQHNLSVRWMLKLDNRSSLNPPEGRSIPISLPRSVLIKYWLHRTSGRTLPAL